MTRDNLQWLRIQYMLKHHVTSEHHNRQANNKAQGQMMAPSITQPIIPSPHTTFKFQGQSNQPLEEVLGPLTFTGVTHFT